MLGCKLHILIERLCHLAFDIPAEVQMQLCISGELCNGYPLFSFSQRAELPECSKVHSVTLKDQFEEASKKRDYRIEEEVYTYLQSFLKDNERKIEGAKKRLILTQETPEMEEKVCDTYVCTLYSSVHVHVYVYAHVHARVHVCRPIHVHVDGCHAQLCLQVEQIHELAVQVGEKVAKAEALGKSIEVHVRVGYVT